jgi:peptidoglycan/xylan/chitin deacetylase (PgdA/CDA1 family)
VTTLILACHQPLPELYPFMPEKMRPGVVPISYIEDACQYLENRWGEGKSAPGTIVVPIMFHSVAKPGWEANDPSAITRDYFEYFMETAKILGYRTITMEELVNFLTTNAEIPERSMIIILDDRRPGVTELFMPYLEENDWTLTLGWITTETTRNGVWETMLALNDTGRLDVQSHGHNHIYIQNYMTDEMIEEELTKPFSVIEERFGTTPVAIIWPGGNFTETAIDIARTAGYQVGFTVFSRGPLLYNWIPLGDQETAMNDPLMVLPRFWSSAAVNALEEGIAVGEAAKLDAEAVWDQEINYLSTYCQALDAN